MKVLESPATIAGYNKPTSLVTKISNSGASIGSIYGSLVFKEEKHLIVAFKDRLEVYDVLFKDKNQPTEDDEYGENLQYGDNEGGDFENEDEQSRLYIQKHIRSKTSDHDHDRDSSESLWSEYQFIDSNDLANDNSKGLVYRSTLSFTDSEVTNIEILYHPDNKKDQENETTDWLLVAFSDNSVRLVNLNPYQYTRYHLENNTYPDDSAKTPISVSWELMISSHAFISDPIFLDPNVLKFTQWGSNLVSYPNTGNLTVEDKVEGETRNETTSNATKSLPKNVEVMARDEAGISIAIDRATNTVAFNAFHNVINIIQFKLDGIKFLKTPAYVFPFNENRKPISFEKYLLKHGISSMFLFIPNKFHIQSMVFLSYSANPTLMLLSNPEYFSTVLDIYNIDLQAKTATKRVDTFDSAVKNESILIPNHGPFGGGFLVGMNQITLFRTPPNDPSVVLSLEQYQSENFSPNKYPSFNASSEANKVEFDPDRLRFPHAIVIKNSKDQLVSSLFVGSQSVAFQSHIVSFATIDAERTLLGDSEGRIYFLTALQKVDKYPVDFQISVKYVGRTSPAASLTWLASSYFFVSSAVDDSLCFELIHKVTQKDRKFRKKNKKSNKNQSQTKTEIELGIREIHRLESNAAILDIASVAPYTEFKDYPVDSSSRQYYKDFVYLACGPAGSSRIKQLKPGMLTKRLPLPYMPNGTVLQFDIDENLKIFPVSQSLFLISTNSRTIPLTSGPSNYILKANKALATDESTVNIFLLDEYIYQVTPTSIVVLTHQFELVQKLKIPLSEFPGTITHAELSSEMTETDRQNFYLYLCIDNQALVACDISSITNPNFDNSEITSALLESNATDNDTATKKVKKMVSHSGVLFVLYAGIGFNSQNLVCYKSPGLSSNASLPADSKLSNFNISKIKDLPSDINDIEILEQEPHESTLLVATKSGRVLGYNCNDFKSKDEVYAIHSFYIGDQAVGFFKAPNVATQAFVRCGPDVFALFHTSVSASQTRLEYLPILLDDESIDPLSIVCSNPVKKYIPESTTGNNFLESFHENNKMVRYTFFVVSQDNLVHVLHTDDDHTSKLLGYKSVERRMGIDILVRKIKVSPSGRYLVAMGLMNLDAKSGPMNKAVHNTIIIYHADTFEEVTRYENMAGIANALEVIPAKYTKQELSMGMDLPEQFNIFVGITNEPQGREAGAAGCIACLCFREGRGLFENHVYSTSRPVFSLAYTHGLLVAGLDGTLAKFRVLENPISVKLDYCDKEEVFHTAGSKHANNAKIRENVNTLCYDLSASGYRDVNDTDTITVTLDNQNRYFDLIAGDLMTGPMITKNLPKSFPDLDLIGPSPQKKHKSHATFDTMLRCVLRVSQNVVISGDSDQTLFFSYPESSDTSEPDNGSNHSTLRKQWYYSSNDTQSYNLHATPNAMARIRWPLADYYSIFTRKGCSPVNGSHSYGGELFMDNEEMSMVLVGATDGSLMLVYTETGKDPIRTLFLRSILSRLDSDVFSCGTMYVYFCFFPFSLPLDFVTNLSFIIVFLETQISHTRRLTKQLWPNCPNF